MRIGIESMTTTPNKSHNPPLEPIIEYGISPRHS
jgi:hypothetical protein